MDRMMRVNANHTTRQNNSGSRKSELMRKISEVDFAIYETVLYLDAYPESREALSYYRTLIDARNALIAEYEAQYGPITAFGNTDGTEWKWTKTPWPWQ